MPSQIVMSCLPFCAKQGRWILAGSLVLGLASRELAVNVRPYIAELIALLLFTACLRTGSEAVRSALSDVKTNLLAVAIFQIVFPLSLAWLFGMLEIHHPLAFAIVLLVCAPALSGSPHLVALLGSDPAPALRLMIIGTALLPLTVLPVFLLLKWGSVDEVLLAVTRLLLTIALAASAAFILRATVMRTPSAKALQSIDGLSIILLGIAVLGLMAAIHDEIARNPQAVLLTLGVALATNFGLQLVVTPAVHASGAAQLALPLGLTAGNRNIALFLTALPAGIMQPVLPFIACYQIPIYLTPLLLAGFYRRYTQPAYSKS